MLALRLPDEIEKRLIKLAKRTGRTKSYYAKEAIVRFLEEMEDSYISVQRLENPGKRVSMKDAEKELDLED